MTRSDKPKVKNSLIYMSTLVAPEVKEALEELAVANECSVSMIVRKALKKYLQDLG